MIIYVKLAQGSIIHGGKNKILQTPTHMHIPACSKQHAPINTSLIGAPPPPTQPPPSFQKHTAEPLEPRQPLESANQRADISQQGSNWSDPVTFWCLTPNPH